MSIVDSFSFFKRRLYCLLLMIIRRSEYYLLQIKETIDFSVLVLDFLS